jgi:hypothetical protein
MAKFSLGVEIGCWSAAGSVGENCGTLMVGTMTLVTDGWEKGLELAIVLLLSLVWAIARFDVPRVVAAAKTATSNGYKRISFTLSLGISTHD